MIEFVVNEKENGKSLEKVFSGRYSAIPYGALRAALRKRDVKVNGSRTSDERTVLAEGDLVKVYLFEQSETCIDVKIIYENDIVLVAEKPQGLLSEPDDAREGEISLIDQIRLKKPSEGHSGDPEEFSRCELCHRLDRNTGGMLFISKNTDYTGLIKAAINAGYYRKIYSVAVSGDISHILPTGGRWVSFDAFLFKDRKQSLVRISDNPCKGMRPISTLLRFLGTGSFGASDCVSFCEAVPVTGRTHQIRAHLAFLGFPVCGDGKYGRESENRLFGLKYQALWASRYEFDSDWDKAGFKKATGLEADAVSFLPRTCFESEPRFR